MGNSPAADRHIDKPDITAQLSFSKIAEVNSKVNTFIPADPASLLTLNAKPDGHKNDIHKAILLL